MPALALASRRTRDLLMKPELTVLPRDLLRKPELTVLPREEWPDRLPRAQVRGESGEWAMITAGLVSEGCLRAVLPLSAARARRATPCRNICNFLPADQVLRHIGQVVGSGAFGVGRIPEDIIVEALGVN